MLRGNAFSSELKERYGHPAGPAGAHRVSHLQAGPFLAVQSARPDSTEGRPTETEPCRVSERALSNPSHSPARREAARCHDPRVGIMSPSATSAAIVVR